MGEEIASLFVSIGADVSGLTTALQTTRANLENLQAQGGLLGQLPMQAEQQALQIVQGVQRGLAPLPAVLRSGLEAPIEATLTALSNMITTRINAIVGQINGAISQINSAMQGLAAGGSGGGGGQRLPGRASGGAVVSGQPYLVGEAGAEIFVPGSGGTIIPNHHLSGLTISGTINVYGVQDVEALYEQLQRVANQRG